VPPRHALLALVIAAAWGVNFVAIDVGLRDLPPLLFVTLRYALTAFPAVLVVGSPQVPWRYVVGVGLSLSAATQALLFVSIDVGMPAGLASLVIQAQVLFTLALGVGLLGERPGARQLAGAAVAVAGMALIAVARGGSHVPPGALALCLGAAAAWGVGNVITRVARPPRPFAWMAWSSLVATGPLLVTSLAVEGGSRVGHAVGSAGAQAIGGLAFVVLGATVFGFTSWAWLLRRHAASQVAPYALLVPVFGIASAWLALDERPSPLELTGAAVAIAGLSLVVSAGRVPAMRA
jgi:O-acetylserine/cysteine efflux transporter